MAPKAKVMYIIIKACAAFDIILYGVIFYTGGGGGYGYTTGGGKLKLNQQNFNPFVNKDFLLL